MRLLVLLIFFSTCFVFSIVRAEYPSLIATLRADTNKTVFGELIEPAGDQNGDGFDDILVGSYTLSIFLYYGGNPMDTSLRIQFDNSSGNILNNIGDVNGDGWDDILTARNLGVFVKQIIYFGGPDIDTVMDQVLGSDSHRSNWQAIRTADINGNGTDEIISRCSIDRDILLYEIRDPLDSIPDVRFFPPNQRYPGDFLGLAEGLVTGDFNGDNDADLAFNVRRSQSEQTNGEVYLYWGGESFDTIPDLIIQMPGPYMQSNEYFGMVLVNPGDLNNDGYDDLYIGDNNSSDSLSFVYFGGPDIDDIPDILINDKANFAGAAGDVNNDGYPDLITSYPIEFSGIGHVHIYYGGPDVDSIWDYRILNSDMPQYQTYFGRDCNGVGDINGDGIDDFAFSALQSNYGEVYICSGWDVGTSVEDDAMTLPLSASLSQNYPNPFNPTTEIQFDLPRKSEVVLDIFNVLGQKVRQLVNGPFSAGSHKVEWDGTDDNGEQVASGVYFYRLKAGEARITKKMVLLK